MPADEELTAALEAALVRELQAVWWSINESHFRGALRAPALELVRTRSTLGRWVPATRTIEISRGLVLEQPWAAVVEVLKHEAAHQYVHEVIGETEESAHGPAFRAACQRLGIDGRAAGVPIVPGDAAPAGRDKIVERIARLLALAESPHRHEAEAAAAAAQRLMLKYNLDAAQTAARRAYRFLHLGRPTGRVLEHERLVAMILGKYFFVEAIWVPVYRPREGKRGTVLEICGAEDNLAMAEYVHAFLHRAAERAWREHRASHAIGSDRDRRTYLAGVMTGFADRLARQTTTHHGQGLVWVGDGELAAYFQRRHPHVRRVRHAGQRRTEAWSHGREAGRRIVLSRPVQAGAVGRGRLLPAKG